VSLKKWLGLNILAKTLDLVTTFYLVSLYGPSIESNPLTANMIYAYGPGLGLVINGSIHTLLIVLLYAFKREKLLKIGAALTLLLPLINSITVFTAR